MVETQQGLGSKTPSGFSRTPFQPSDGVPLVFGSMDSVTNSTWWTRRAQTIAGNWNARNAKMKDWYNILLLEDKLKKPGLESVVANDPRTSFNLATHILSRSFLRHGESLFPVSSEFDRPLADLAVQMDAWWELENKRNMSRGRRAWLTEVSQHMLATGWYAVKVDPDETKAEIISPAQVFPEYDPDMGTIEVVHAFRLTKHQSLIKAQNNGWNVESFDPLNTGLMQRLKGWFNNPNDTVQWYDHWIWTGDGAINAVLADGEFMRRPMAFTDLDKIPIFTGPAKGLPDRGEILSSDWTKSAGESFVGVSEELWHNMDRQLTYLQQLLRDTAQARWKVRGNVDVTKEELERRGGVFRMDENSDISMIDGIPIPVEISTQLHMMSGMLQRDTFPHSIFGDVTGQISTLQMSQIAGAAQHVLTPYSDALTTLLGEIDNMWLRAVNNMGEDPLGNLLPIGLPDNLILKVSQYLSVPGDAVARANFSKMMNPDFTLSPQTLMELSWPEVDNPLEEIERSKAYKALNSPPSQRIDLIIALEIRSNEEKIAGNERASELYAQEATRLRQQGAGQDFQPPGPPGPTGPAGPPPSPNVAPQTISTGEFV